MKKLILAFGAAAVMVAGFSSCGNGTSSNASVSAEDKALADSASTIIGEFAAARSASDYERLKEMQPEMAKNSQKQLSSKVLKRCWMPIPPTWHTIRVFRWVSSL